jgi:hypothetical protein
MLKHLLGITAATAGIILCTVLPFLSGRYDSLAVPLSGMSRIFGTVGLLLVPIGALWVASKFWSRLAAKQYGIATAALIVFSVTWVMVSIGALVSSLLLGLGALVLWIYVVSRVWPRMKLLKSATARPTSTVAFYVLIVPVAVALLQMAVVAPAIEFSRNRAIRNSARLIADIEQYRVSHGRYPASLLSEWEDYYVPGVIGIEKYHYEPSGDVYNLIFEQFALHFGTREFVVYNPRDRQVMTAHKRSLLHLTPEELALEQSRGHYAVHDAPHPHWKYFWFD